MTGTSCFSVREILYRLIKSHVIEIPSHMQVNNSKTSYEDWLAQSYIKQMSGNQHNRQAATWRKLYLSRAKLKASSSTSALLSGFAMVRAA